MSNIIEFNAGEFKFDVSCKQGAGSRVFVTDFKGNNVQVFDLGDWQWTWSQITCDKQLEPGTDYVFRFAVLGGVNNTGDGQSHFMVICDEDFEHRLEFPLEQSRFKPTVSKKTENGFLRVFEIPFTTDSGYVRFIFTAQHFAETIMPAYDTGDYADLEDQTYAELWQEIQDRQNAANTTVRGSFGRLNLSGAEIHDPEIVKNLIGLVEKGHQVDLDGAMLGYE